jgi:Tol biopolymer transport system component
VSTDGSQLLLFSNVDLWTAPVLGGPVKLLGPGLGGTFSPDGASILFWSLDGEISLAHRDGSGLRSLAAPGYGLTGLGEISLSPDGKLIRFAKDGAIWQMNADGTSMHPLLPNWHEPGAQSSGRWTPDGSLYLFIVGAPSARGPVGEIWALDERRGLFHHPSAEPFPLTNGPIRWTGPLPGRDGKTVFAVGQTPRGELSRWDAKTHQFQPYLGGISTDDVEYSRDGKYVAYVSWPDSVLWRADRDGSNAVQLTQTPVLPMNIGWSPDGKQIVFYDRATWRMNSIPSDGGTLSVLLPGGKDRILDPYWSPDGKQILFSSVRMVGGGTWLVEGHTLDVATGQVATIPGGEGLRPEGWSPDGRYIVALDWKSGKGMKILDLRTKRWTNLTVAEANYPQFSHDGRFVYFLQTVQDHEGEDRTVVNHLDVVRIPVSGGMAERVVDMKDFHTTGYWSFSMQLDPTDAPLVLRDISSDDIYALDVKFE